MKIPHLDLFLSSIFVRKPLCPITWSESHRLSCVLEMWKKSQNLVPPLNTASLRLPWFQLIFALVHVCCQQVSRHKQIWLKWAWKPPVVESKELNGGARHPRAVGQGEMSQPCQANRNLNLVKSQRYWWYDQRYGWDNCEIRDQQAFLWLKLSYPQ